MHITKQSLWISEKDSDFLWQDGRQIILQQSPRIANVATSSMLYSQFSQKSEAPMQSSMAQSDVCVMPAKIPR